MGSITKQPDYGRRLLPIVIQTAAEENPNRVVYSFPITDDPSKGFHDITNRRYANGMNRTAWFLDQNFGKPTNGSFPTIGYIGPNDLRYALLATAAVKSGYKMVYLSPRNSIDGHLAVIDKCNCNLWLLPSQKLGHVDQVIEKRKMTVVAMPELLELLDEESVPVYPYNKTFAEARQDPFLVLHTSGSTGLPKPVVVPNGSLSTPDAQHLLPPIEGRLTQTQYFLDPHRAYSTFPNFHSAGMVFCFALPFFYDLSIVMGPAMVPVNLDLINSMLDHANVDGSLLAPSMLEEISKNPASIERMAKTLFTCFGGGPLSQECGDRINAVTRCVNIFGVTEGSLFPIVQAEREDWNYLHFHPGAGFTYKQRSEDLWEQFQTRDPKLDLFQAFLQTFPDQDEVAIKDLYSKHPTKPGRWFYRGRTDDVIVLSNGEKLNPLDMEASINDHPAVQFCLIVGQGRFQTTALIQLSEPPPVHEDDIKTLKQSLWVKMVAANREAPAHAQLHKDYIMFASPDKPFLMAGKGTVLRAMTIKLYETEIHDFYAQQEQLQASDAYCLDITSLKSIRNGVHDLICQILDLKDLSEDEDFFAAGIDSLSVFKILTTLRVTLQSITESKDKPITAGLIYTNPTVEKLAIAFEQLVRPVAGAQEVVTDDQLMTELLMKYTSNLPERSVGKTKSTANGVSVILTGSTGSLGSYLLDSLLSQQHIRRVFCINRSADAAERQYLGNKSRGLIQELDSDRVRFLQADLAKPNFGLDQTSYDELLQETTHIIHNQWQVDFNLTLSSFEPHIRGVRNLVDFSIQNSNNPALFFISSVGVVKNQRANSQVPEALITEFSGAEGGYGRSKLVAELILAEAYQKSGVQSYVCRLGQIAGPVDTDMGVWNRHEWLPSIIASSKFMQSLPSTLSSLNRVDWFPVNRATKIILELLNLHNEQGIISTATGPEMPVFHIVNPSACNWPSLVPSIASSLGSSVAIVPWETWLSKLEASQENGDLKQYPGIKLLDFYKGADEFGKAGLELPILETKKTQARSETLRSLGPVNEQWMAQWMKQWAL